MSNAACDEFNLGILTPDLNRAYLPQPIPTARDGEICTLLSLTIADHRVARFAHCLEDGHAMVLRAFSERMASAAVRARDPEKLRLGLIALLLAWPGPDSRDSLTILPLFCDASGILGLDSASFVATVRQSIGDQLSAPFVEFLTRSDKNQSLKSMGYSRGADKDGFRYIRNW
jgi:hypothetical protein